MNSTPISDAADLTQGFGFAVNALQFSQAYAFAKMVGGGNAVVMTVTNGRLYFQSTDVMSCQTSIQLVETSALRYPTVPFSVLGNLHIPMRGGDAGPVVTFELQTDGVTVVNGMLTCKTGPIVVSWPYTLSPDDEVEAAPANDGEPVAIEPLTEALRLAEAFASKKTAATQQSLMRRARSGRAPLMSAEPLV